MNETSETSRPAVATSGSADPFRDPVLHNKPYRKPEDYIGAAKAYANEPGSIIRLCDARATSAYHGAWITCEIWMNDADADQFVESQAAKPRRSRRAETNEERASATTVVSENQTPSTPASPGGE